MYTQPIYIYINTVAFFFVTCLFREYGKVFPENSKIQKFENSKNWKKNTKNQKFENSKNWKTTRKFKNSKKQKNIRKFENLKKHIEIQNSKIPSTGIHITRHPALATGHASGRENHRQRTRNESAPIEKSSIHVAKISVQDIQVRDTIWHALLEKMKAHIVENHLSKRCDERHTRDTIMCEVTEQKCKQT